MHCPAKMNFFPQVLAHCASGYNINYKLYIYIPILKRRTRIRATNLSLYVRLKAERTVFFWNV